MATIVVAAAVTTEPAEARRRHRAVKSHSVKAKPVKKAYAPPQSWLVVDANTGAVLAQNSPDALRHPASLTKIMTLYLLFERLESGKISLASQLRVSAHAATMAPSKLNLSPGDTINVESAIKAVVTKSANDVAVVIAENIGGDEASFARMMTQKARALGMKNTTYHNASGLPNDDQWTTARDQVTLGRAIQERFPRYYSYFSTRNFVFEGKAMRNHNHLLGRVEGVDGIKTGYINASGFNLVTSLRRDGRHLVASIFGGRSGRSRDAQMQAMLSKTIVMASTKKTAPVIAEAAVPPTRLASANPVEVKVTEQKPLELKPMPLEARTQEPKADTRPTDMARELRATAYSPEVGSKDPIKPVMVKTLTVKGPSMQTASLAPSDNAPVRVASVKPSVVTQDAKLEKPIDVQTDGSSSAAERTASVPPPGARPGVLGVLPIRVASADPSVSPAAAADPAKRSGWFIQVGALETEKAAKERLAQAREAARNVLKRAEAYTEVVKKGSRTFYRARFAGFDEAGAEAACREVKANKIVCMPARN